nr:hypothetical protein [Endozoicomonas sp.]
MTKVPDTVYCHIELGSGNPCYEEKGFYYDVLTRKIVTNQNPPAGSQPASSQLDDKASYDNHRERFSSLESTLDYLVNKLMDPVDVNSGNPVSAASEAPLSTGIGQMSLSSSNKPATNPDDASHTRQLKTSQEPGLVKKKPAFDNLRFLLSDLEPNALSQAHDHLLKHIKFSHPTLADRIKVEMLAGDMLSPDIIAERKPNSVHLKYSDAIIPQDISGEEYQQYLHKKIELIIELGKQCTSCDAQGLICVFNYLVEYELYLCTEPEEKHPFRKPIIGQQMRCLGFDDRPIPLPENSRIALFKPCPCLYPQDQARQNQENAAICPGNPPGDTISNSDTDSSSD